MEKRKAMTTSIISCIVNVKASSDELALIRWQWLLESNKGQGKDKGKGKGKGKGMEHFLLSKPLKKEHDIFRIVVYKKNDMLRIEVLDMALMAVTF